MDLGPLSKSDVEGAYDAAQRVVQTHERLSAWLRPGQTLADIDRFVAKTLEELGARSCFLHYQPPGSVKFPSHACLSLNNCLVHGTAGYYTATMKPGDVLKIDVGVTYRGWIGDAAWTYVFGEMTPQVRKLTDAGKQSLAEGVKALRSGDPYVNWASVVQKIVEGEYGFHLVRGLGGHGYGRKLHEPPYISNVVPTYPGEWPDAHRRATPGTLLAVEPMIAVGTGQVRQSRRQWPIFTADDSLAVHYEHDVLVTEHGPRVLTEGLTQINDVIV